MEALTLFLPFLQEYHKRFFIIVCGHQCVYVQPFREANMGTCPSQFELLPVELHCKIAKHIVNYDDRQACRKVSKNWRKFFDENVREDLVIIGNGHDELLLRHRMSKLGSLTVYDYTLTYRLYLKKLDSVQHLCTSNIHPDLLLRLLQTCKNLKTISFDNIGYLPVTDRYQLAAIANVCKLRYNISSNRFLYENASYKRGLIKLLNQSPQNLKNLELHSDTGKSEIFYAGRRLFTFLAKCKKLRSILIKEAAVAYQSDSKRINARCWKDGVHEKTLDDLLLLQLTTVTIVIYMGDEDTWKKLLLRQRSLLSLKSKHVSSNETMGFTFDFLSKLIEHNQTSLKVLMVDIVLHDDKNCAAILEHSLANSSLEKLALNSGRITQPIYLMLFNMLPPNLTTLQLHYLQVASKCSVFTRKFPNLVEVSILNTCDAPFSLSCFESLLQNGVRKIRLGPVIGNSFCSMQTLSILENLLSFDPIVYHNNIVRNDSQCSPEYFQFAADYNSW